MLNAQKNKRIDWIDVSKGIGVILLVIGHMPSIPYVIQNWIYSFHMPLFFFLSGYTFKIKDSPKDNIKKMFRRLIVPYLIYDIIFLLSDIILFGRKSATVNADLNDMISGQGSCGVIWFLLSLFWVQIIYLVVSVITNNYKNVKFANIVIVLIVLSGDFIATYCKMDLYKLVTSLVAVGFFYLGNIFMKLMIMDKIKQMSILCLFLCINIIFGYINLLLYGTRIEMSGAIYNNLFIMFVAAITGIIFVIGVSEKLSKLNLWGVKCLKYIGKNSLYFFVLTAYIPVRMMQLLEGSELDNLLVKIISKILGFVLTYVVVEVLSHIKKKYHKFICEKRLDKWSYNKCKTRL